MFDTKIYESDPHQLKKLIEKIEQQSEVIRQNNRELRELISVFKELRDILRPKAKSATLIIRPNTWDEEEYEVYQYLSEKGRRFMPATIVVGGTATAVFTEFDGPNGTGNVVAPIQAPAFSSSDESVATVDASGLVTGIAPGTVTITGTDAGNGLTASDSASVSGSAAAQSATLVVTAN